MSASRENPAPFRQCHRPTGLLRKSADERLPIDLLPLALHAVGGAVVKQQEALHNNRQRKQSFRGSSILVIVLVVSLKELTLCTPPTMTPFTLNGSRSVCVGPHIIHNRIQFVETINQQNLPSPPSLCTLPNDQDIRHCTKQPIMLLR